MANPTYNRENFFDIMVDESNITLTDPVAFTFTELFEFLKTKTVRKRVIQESEEGAPELIALQEYGDQQYWWVIMLVNKIQDPINELIPGVILAVPELKDIEEFRQSVSTSISRGQTVILR